MIPSPPASIGAAIGSLRARLGRLRSRIRRIATVSGTARIVLAAAALLAASFLADRLLDLPIGVRRFVRLGLVDRPVELPVIGWFAAVAIAAAGFVATARRGLAAASVFAFVLGGVPGVLAFVAWRALIRPLSGRPSDERLAADVERRHRALNDRLLAALDFERELAQPTRGESPVFMAKTVDEADHEARSLVFASVASSRRAWARFGAALVAAGAFAGVCATTPVLASIWWRRSARLEEVSWPRATRLVVIMRDAAGGERPIDPATPYVVSLGQSLTVSVHAEGTVPADVEILDRTERDGPSGRALAHRMRAVAGAERLFEHEFREVRGDFSFFVRGGDDRDELPLYRVSVRVPPRVVDLRADLTFPAYLALPPRHVANGSFSVPEGTDVTLAFEADVPLSHADVFVDDLPVTVETRGATHLVRWKAEKPFRYRIRIAAADGRENDAAVDVYEVAVEPDTPARPEWVWPRGPTESTPEGRVPLFAQTRDDHGVATLRLDVDVPGAPMTSIPLVERTADAPDGANDRPYGMGSIRSYVPLEIASLADAEGRPLTAQRRISVRVTAVDSRGQESSGAWAPIDLLKPDELERSFSSRRTALKSDVEGLRKDLKDTRELTAAPSAADGADDVERRSLRDVQFRLGKLRSDVERAARIVTSLFNAHVYGRIGSKAPNERILAILDRRHRTTFVQSDRRPTAEAGLEGTIADVDAEVFPYDLYRDVMTARRERRLLESDVLDRLVSVLDSAVTTAAELAPAAHEASVAAARTGARAEVSLLLEAEDRLAAGLDDVLSAMAQWQSLAELTLFVRRLIEEQEALRGGIRNLGK